MRKITQIVLLCLCALWGYQARAQFDVSTVGDVGAIVNELSTRVIAGDTLQYLELLVVGCPGRGEFTGSQNDSLGPDPHTVDLRGWIIDDNNGNGDFGNDDGISQGHIRFSNSPVWAAVPVGSIILIYNRRGYIDDNPFIDDPDDTDPANGIYITALGDAVAGQPLFVQDATNNVYQAYTVGDGQPNIQGTYTATNAVNSWDLLFFDGAGDVAQIRAANGTFFHGIVWGTLDGGTLATNNGAGVPASTQGANRSGTDATNSIIFLSHNNTNGIFLDNYRHGNNYTITAIFNATNSTPARSNTTTADRNGQLRTNLRNSLDAGEEQIVCDLESRFNPTGVIGFWSPNDMWRFTGNFNLDADIFNVWTQVTDNAQFPPPGPAFITDNQDPTSTVRVELPGVYIFRRSLPDEDELPGAATTEYCIDSDIVKITFLGVPIADAGSDIGVCGNSVILDGEGGFDINPEWEYQAGSGPEGAPDPIITDNEDPNPTTVRVEVTEPGTYTFRYRIGADDCRAVDNVRVTFAFGDFEPNAGTDRVLCGLNFDLEANSEPTNSAYWTIDPSSPTTTGVRFDGEVHNPADPLNPRADNPNARVVVPAAGIYRFIWNYGFSEGSVNCVQADTVQIRFLNVANSNAGADQTICGFTTNLTGSPGVGGSITDVQWSVANSPAGSTVTFGTPTAASTSVTVDTQGLYRFRFSVTGEDDGVTCSDGDDVEIFFIEAPQAIAEPRGYCGLSGVLDAEDTFQDVTGDGVIDDVGEWTVVGGPDIPGVTVADPTDPESGISVVTPGVYTLRWTVTRTVNGVPCPASVDVTYFFVEDFEGPGQIPNAGADQPEVCGNTTDLEGNALIVGDATATWIVDPSIDLAELGITSVIFNTANTPTANVEVLPIDFGGNLDVELSFIWVFSKTVTVDDLTITCSNQDTVNVRFFATPVPEAGEADTVCIGQADYPYALNGNLPTGTNINGEWTQVGGPAGGVATFDDATNPNSTVTVNSEGNYTFQWALTNGTACPAVTDNVEIFFLNPATSDAGLPQENICEFQATITGNTPAGTDVGEWTLVSGPSDEVSIANPNSSSTTVTITSEVPGDYTFRWTVFRVLGGTRFCGVSSEVILNFINQPEANAGADQPDICFNDVQTANLSANTPAAPFTGAWTVTNSPLGANVSFNNANSPSAAFTTDVEGFYTLRWTVSGGINCLSSDEVEIVFIRPVDAAVVAPPAEVCGLTTTLTGLDQTAQITFGQWTANPAAGVVFSNPNEENTTVTVPSPGNYTFTWTIGNGQCEDAATTAPVQFFPTLVNPTAEQDIVVLLGQTVDLFADGGPDAIYTWTSADDPTLARLGGAAAVANNPTPTFTASAASPNVFNYVVTMTTGFTLNDNDANCTVSIPVRVRIFTELNVPNVFSPNGDGQFDTWQIPLLEGIPGSETKVFNRWGDLVFESTGYTEPWNGKVKNTGSLVPHSTYYYVITRPDEPTVTGYVVVTY